jgi:hypothetical protein
VKANQIRKPANINRFVNQQRLKESLANLDRFKSGQRVMYLENQMPTILTIHHINISSPHHLKPPSPVSTPNITNARRKTNMAANMHNNTHVP